MKIIIKLIPYYWIIQGLLIAITIRGLGSLPFIGCILLIVCTILYMIYSIIFIIIQGIVFLFFGFYNIHILILIVAILNVALSFIQLRYSDK